MAWWLGAWRQTAIVAAPILAVVSYLTAAHGRDRADRMVWPNQADFLKAAGRTAVLGYGLAVLCLAGLDILHQVRLPQLVSPLVSNPIEGREALKGWLLSQGQNIYPAGSGYPRLITLYPPLYYAVAAGFAWLAGPGLWCGKLAAASGLALILVALFGLARRGAGSALVGIVAGLAFFITPEAGNGFVCKPDTWAFGLVLAAAWAFTAGRHEARPYGPMVLAGTLLALAAFAKQQTWPLAAGFFLYALAARVGWRRGIAFALSLAGAGLALGAAAYVLFGPGLLEQAVLFPGRMTALAGDNSLAAALARMREYASEHAALLVAYAGWLALCLIKRRLPLPDVLLLVFLPFLARTLMWGGSDANHFLFVSAVAALGAACLAGACLAGGPAARGVGCLALAALLPMNLTLTGLSRADFAPAPAPAEEAQALEARQTLAAIPGPVLMDAEGAYLFAGEPDFSRLRLYDAFETDIYDRLGLAPILDSPMAADIRGRRLARFVDSQVFISKSLLALRDIYYEPAERVGRYALYRPRPERAIVAVPVADRVAREDGGLTVQVTTAQNIRNWGSYIQAEDSNAPLELAYEAVSDTPVERATVTFCPRLTEPGQSVTVIAEDGHGRRTTLALFGYGDGKEGGEGWDNRTTVAFAPAGETFRVIFSLGGAAQLWLDAVHPLVFSAASRSIP